MSKASVERRLRQVAGRLRQLREELDVTDEQLTQLAGAADDAHLRALVSETPLAGEDHRQAERHAEAMRRHRAHVLDEISRLERSQDELLDEFVAESRPEYSGTSK
jgi:predicted  nucleic acid-binding Zn-ribbon protein